MCDRCRRPSSVSKTKATAATRPLTTWWCGCELWHPQDSLAETRPRPWPAIHAAFRPRFGTCRPQSGFDRGLASGVPVASNKKLPSSRKSAAQLGGRVQAGIPLDQSTESYCRAPAELAQMNPEVPQPLTEPEVLRLKPG